MFAFSVATGLLYEGQSLEEEIQGPKNLEKLFIGVFFKGWSGIPIWISRVPCIGMNSTLGDSKECHSNLRKAAGVPSELPTFRPRCLADEEGEISV